jgi:RHS repeat-associated protein
MNLGGTATAMRRAQWTVYQDASFATWTGYGYGSGTGYATYTLINPVRIEQRDAAERVRGQIEAVRAGTSGALSASDTFAQASWTRWAAFNYDSKSQLTWRRDYFLIPSSGPGSAGTNYNETDFDYDSLGRRIGTRAGIGGSGTGTVTRQVLNPMGWVLSGWVGTDDTGATPSDPTGGGATGNNMAKVTDNTWDNGSAGGDGNLTTAVQYAAGSDARTTTFGYDFRNRRTYTDGEIDFYETYGYDNVDRLTQTDRYNTVSTGNLIARSQAVYDARGRVYQNIVYGVDPSTGSAGNALTQNLWYDATGNVMLNQNQSDRGFTKMSYDGLNRLTASYAGCNSSAQTYATASTVAADTVVGQTLNTWDGASNLTLQTTGQRDHNATGTGALNGPSGSQPQSRVSYVAFYPDPLGRAATMANYGTNGGSALTPPSVPASPSDTILVSSNAYDSAGNLTTVTDPQGVVTQRSFDNLGRLTQTVEDYGGLARTTGYTYHANGKIRTLTATNATTGNQVTTWNYGTGSGDDVYSNEWLHSKVLPDVSTDSTVYHYNALGQVKQQTDPNGTVRQFLYDKLGRLTDDKATTLHGGLDALVQRISRTYEVRGMVQTVTSFDSPTGGTVVNDVELSYNNFRQLQTDSQSHSGAVVPGTTLKVAYAYEAGTVNTVRLETMTYPNGRVLTYDYGVANSIDDLRDRVLALEDGLHALAVYTRFGLDRTVVVQYPQPDLSMTYIGTPGGDGGDQYVGLDRFGRVIDNRWINGSGTDIERFKYTFSRASNRLTRQNVVAATLFDEQYVYDNLYEVTNRKLGTLSGGVITGTPVEEEQFSFDPTGNWPTYLTKANGTTTLNQTRTAQKANEITAISGGITPVYDANGNMTTMPDVGTWALGQTITYDAWNRPVVVTEGGTLGVYYYDGLNRRITKTNPSGIVSSTRHYYYSKDWQVIEERTSGGSSPSSSSSSRSSNSSGSSSGSNSNGAERQYIWGVRYRDDLILRDRYIGSTTERLYALSDYFQTTSICTAAGGIQERYVYRAFGSVSYFTPGFAASTSSYGWTYLYGGYQLDLETLLYQVRNRYYHSALGRWITRDPLKNAERSQGANLYWYVFNNAVNKVDPSGLKWTQVSESDRFASKGWTLASWTLQWGPTGTPFVAQLTGAVGTFTASIAVDCICGEQTKTAKGVKIYTPPPLTIVPLNIALDSTQIPEDPIADLGDALKTPIFEGVIKGIGSLIGNQAGTKINDVISEAHNEDNVISSADQSAIAGDLQAIGNAAPATVGSWLTGSPCNVLVPLFALLFLGFLFKTLAEDSKPIKIGPDGRGYLTDQSSDGTITTRILQMEPKIRCVEVKQVDKSGNITQWYQHFFDAQSHEILTIVRKTPSNPPDYAGIISIWARTYNKNGSIEDEYEYEGNSRLMDHAVNIYSWFGKWLRADHYNSKGTFSGSTYTPPENFLDGEKSK